MELGDVGELFTFRAARDGPNRIDAREARLGRALQHELRRRNRISTREQWPRSRRRKLFKLAYARIRALPHSQRSTRERTAQRGFYRGPGRDARSLEGRPACDRVGVEPLRLGDGSDPRDVLGRVHEQQLLLACRATFAPQVLVLEQRGQPLAPLRVVAGGMEARERRVRQDVDRTISASSSRLLPSPCATPSR